jgi:hypothetical protein
MPEERISAHFFRYQRENFGRLIKAKDEPGGVLSALRECPFRKIQQFDLCLVS